MDELSNIEARRDVNVANLRRAFQPVDPSTDSGDPTCRFADLLGRLAARGATSRVAPGRSRPPLKT